MKKGTVKTLALLLALTFIFALAACGSPSTGGGTTGGGSTSSGGSTGGATTTPSTGGSSSSDETFVFTLGTSTTEESVNWYLIKTFAEMLEEKTGGRITSNLYPNSQLGSDQTCLEETMAGNITGFATSVNLLTSYVPDTGVYDQAFDFTSVDMARAVINEEAFLAVMQEKIGAIGIKLFKMMNSRFRMTTSVNPIHTIDDFKGLKIRVQNNPNHIALWTAIGANPTPMDFAEVYISLQQGAIDAQENPLDVCNSNKMYEPCKYYGETMHLCHNMALWFSSKTFESLPADLQEIVTATAVEATDAAMAEVDARNDRYLQQLKDNDVEYITYDEATIKQLSGMVKDANAAVRAKLSAEVLGAYDAAVEKWNASH